MRCLADFVLDSDLCFPDGATPFRLNAPGGEYFLVLSNATDDRGKLNAVLSAQLIFEVDSLGAARESAQIKLANILSHLAYVTNRKFSIITLKRVIDWTPGIVERPAIIFVETPEWNLAEPKLDSAFLNTVERMLAMQSGEEQQTAMRWYRLAIRADNIEDQFSYFWFALEIAAQKLKGTEKVPSSCPHCNGALYCQSCDTHPVHKRFASQAIQQIIYRVHPQDGDEVFKALHKVRNTLMHGGRIQSILDDLPCDEQQIVSKLAFVTWRAIGLMFDKPDPQPVKPLHFGFVDNVARRNLVASVKIVTTMLRGDPDDPQIEDFSSVDFQMETSLPAT